MAEIEIKVPPVGESITEVTIGSWFKKEGDFVKLDEVICGLDSDKATFELAAESEGILHIKAQEGDTIAIGDVIATIETGSAAKAESAGEPEKKEAPAAAESTPAPAPAPAQGSANVVEMKVPVVGESISEVTIASWTKKDGDTVQLDEIICELESDKATFELPAEASGILRHAAAQGDTLAIGEVIARIEAGAAPAQTSIQKAADSSAATVKSAPESHAAGGVTPLAANILAEKGISPSEVKGTGAGGKITRDDALNASKTTAPAAAAQPAAATPTAAQPAAQADARGQRREKMSALRRTIARRLVSVKNETAMLTTFNEVDMKPIMDLRNKFKDKFKEKYEVGLGFMSFFTKAATVALRDFPAVNAYIDGDDILYNDFCDVSIAVSTPRGLVVPVIRSAEKLSFAEIEKEIIRLATRARDGKLGIDEMTGGTFTITNGGVFGSMLSTPIINAPQSAILGMHNIVERPVVVNGEIVIRPVMYVALSYDHRIIDGKDSVSFLVRIKQILEDPARLLFDL
ncbi:MAG: dihydrolipoamide succinyltransferase [Cytophagaceae bacterium SCN 52-12]|nr:MAG: dihydrolipoamide succinyltransferase [Cytophagaceae bacterium SCN 52-12]